MSAQGKLKFKPLATLCSLVMWGYSTITMAESTVEFNTDILDVSDRSNIDVEQFSRAGFIMPGEYNMTIRVNKTELPEMNVSFIAPQDDPKGSVACLSPELITKLGLKPNVLANITYWHEGECADISPLNGMVVRPDLSSSTLYLNIPQAYVEYSSESWDPPSRWDDGEAGVLFDYSVNMNHTLPRNGSSSDDISGNGVAGFNAGPWRFRATWQGDRYQNGNGSTQNWDWTQYYVYRAIPRLQSKLMMGEAWLESDMFDRFRFTGASLRSDDSQLPPNLRGYAPEISGVARTNAKVTVSQQGRVLYETQVAPGPFLIQELSDSVSGKLNVKVEEQDGSHQEFEVDTATIPYLSRPGQVRYKVAAGKPSNQRHVTTGSTFGTGEFSWGISNGWSLLGGFVTDGQYHALSAGVGRDLLALGAMSFDATQSHVSLPESGTRTGGSYRLSYAKRFEEYDTQVTFAGYRFSQRNFIGMNQYLAMKEEKQTDFHSVGSSKQLYTITLNKQFRSAGLSLFLNYSHQTYWDSPATNRWNLSLARYFDLGRFKNLNVSLSAYRSELKGKQDDGAYLSISVPFGYSSTMGYNLQQVSGNRSQSVSWSDRVDESNSYQLTARTASGSSSGISGYYSHEGDFAQTSASASYQQGDYSAIGASAQGGITATTKGAAFHRINMVGGTRLMVDTDGVADVPVRGNGSVTHTNMFGKAVIADVNSYYRNNASIDLDQLGENVEAARPITQITLTEGAIGYREFGVIAGQKIMAVIRLLDGSFPPFGASVLSKGRETGIVNDNGNVWLSGVEPGIKMEVRWGSDKRCTIKMPETLPDNTLEQPNMLLPCEFNAD